MLARNEISNKRYPLCQRRSGVMFREYLEKEYYVIYARKICCGYINISTLRNGPVSHASITLGNSPQRSRSSYPSFRQHKYVTRASDEPKSGSLVPTSYLCLATLLTSFPNRIRLFLRLSSSNVPHNLTNGTIHFFS